MIYAFQLSDKVGAQIKSSGWGQKVGLITQVESALGLLNLQEVCIHITKQDSLPFSLEAIIFGSDDFLVSIGEALSVRVRGIYVLRPKMGAL